MGDGGLGCVVGSCLEFGGGSVDLSPCSLGAVSVMWCASSLVSEVGCLVASSVWGRGFGALGGLDLVLLASAFWSVC